MESKLKSKVFLMILGSALALSSAAVAGSIVDEGFYRYDQLSQLPEEKQPPFDIGNAIGASIGISVPMGRATAIITGIDTSPNGPRVSLLTVLHNISNQYPIMSALESEEVDRDPTAGTITLADRFEFPSPRLPERRIFLPDTRFFELGQHEIPELVASGDAEFETIQTFMSSTSTLLNIFDYALLSVEPSSLPAPETIPCLPFSRELPEIGEPVWLIGFPRAAVRKNAGSSGFSKHISYGTVLSIEEEKITSSADSTQGFSGGAIVNRDGRIVGVMNSVPKGSHSERRFPGESYSLSSQFIWEDLVGKLGEERANEILNCPQHQETVTDDPTPPEVQWAVESPPLQEQMSPTQYELTLAVTLSDHLAQSYERETEEGIWTPVDTSQMAQHLGQYGAFGGHTEVTVIGAPENAFAQAMIEDFLRALPTTPVTEAQAQEIAEEFSQEWPTYLEDQLPVELDHLFFMASVRISDIHPNLRTSFLQGVLHEGLEVTFDSFLFRFLIERDFTLDTKEALENIIDPTLFTTEDRIRIEQVALEYLNPTSED